MSISQEWWQKNTWLFLKLSHHNMNLVIYMVLSLFWAYETIHIDWIHIVTSLHVFDLYSLIILLVLHMGFLNPLWYSFFSVNFVWSLWLYMVYILVIFNIISCCFCCFCCWYWPLVREVFPKYEVVKFQPRTLTNPYPGSVAYCYVSYLLDPPHPLLLLFDVLPPPHLTSVCLCNHHHMVIRLTGRPLSPSQHTKNPSPSLLLPITSQDGLLLPSLSPATPVGFLSPPLPCWCRDIFQRGLQLLLRSLLLPPHISQLTPSIISRLLFIDLKYLLKFHPLRYSHLPLSDILTQRLSSCRLKQPVRTLLFPNIFP